MVVCTFHDGCKQGIDQQIFNRKSISRKITHPQFLCNCMSLYRPVSYATTASKMCFCALQVPLLANHASAWHPNNKLKNNQAILLLFVTSFKCSKLVLKKKNIRNKVRTQKFNTKSALYCSSEANRRRLPYRLRISGGHGRKHGVTSVGQIRHVARSRDHLVESVSVVNVVCSVVLTNLLFNKQ